MVSGCFFLNSFRHFSLNLFTFSFCFVFFFFFCEETKDLQWLSRSCVEILACLNLVSASLSVYSFIYLPTFSSVCLLSACQSVCLSVNQSVCLQKSAMRSIRIICSSLFYMFRYSVQVFVERESKITKQIAKAGRKKNGKQERKQEDGRRMEGGE